MDSQDDAIYADGEAHRGAEPEPPSAADEAEVHGEASEAEPPAEPPTAESELRLELLEHLVEFWHSQGETLRLSRLWTRYEKALTSAKDAALTSFSEHGDDFESGFKAAKDALDSNNALTIDQRAYALRMAVREQRPAEAFHRDGYAGAALRKARERQKDLGLLSAQLVGLVADFELFVLRTTTAWLSYNSDHLAGRKRELTFREITALDTVQELQESIVQAFLEEHMRKSASAWFSEFCKLFDVKSIEGATDFATLEVFQRRHVIVHHAGIVSRQYVEALRPHKLTVAVGDDLPVDLDYVKRAADALACVAHSIAVSALISSSSGKAEERKRSDAEIGELTYILLQLRRENVVDRFLAKYDLDRVGHQFAREQLRVNGWISKRRLGTIVESRAEIEQWDVDALGDDFKLAKLILLGDREDAVAMAVMMSEQGRLSPYSVAIWPLFEEIAGEYFEAMDAMHLSEEHGESPVLQASDEKPEPPDLGPEGPENKSDSTDNPQEDAHPGAE